MVSTFTPNVQIEQPARGDDVGTWDTPVNNNMSILDLIVGGEAFVSLSNANVTLSAAQFRCRQIIFQSTLSANVTVTFPTSFTKSYEIFHNCTGSSAFTITLATTAAGSVVCAIPGDTINVVNDVNGSFRYMNLGRIGSYFDYCGSSVPNWVSGCTIPPYLNCNGTTFSSATYPQLATILGSTTLPDSRAGTRVALDQGTGRLGTVINGNTVGSVGGIEVVTLTIGQMPVHAHSINDPGHQHTYNSPAAAVSAYAGGGFNAVPSVNSANDSVQPTNISILNSGGGAAHSNLQPSYIGGITMIRAG